MKNSYYQTSVNSKLSGRPLQGSLSCDVCIIGGGVAGLSSALDLNSRGYSVILLEAQDIGAGASGHNGGQVVPGYACSMSSLRHNLGEDHAQKLWQMSVLAIDKIETNIRDFKIDCSWTRGVCQVAAQPRHFKLLEKWKKTAERDYRYSGLVLLDRVKLQTQLDSPRYFGGLLDTRAGHLHPLNYVLGLAAAAEKKDVLVFERSPVINISEEQKVRVRTLQGEVVCEHLVLAAGMGNGKLAPRLAESILPGYVYMAATNPLESELARSLIANNMAIYDTKIILDFYRLSTDHRLLFGGKVSYRNLDPQVFQESMRQQILKIFPQLNSMNVEYIWGGSCDMTVKRLPDFGRLSKKVFYIQGLSGHGLNVGTLSGTVIAEAIAGSPQKLEIFENIRHEKYRGGLWVRQMLTSYYSLLDHF